jgi:hypothetical protein
VYYAPVATPSAWTKLGNVNLSQLRATSGNQLVVATMSSVFLVNTTGAPSLIRLDTLAGGPKGVSAVAISGDDLIATQSNNTAYPVFHLYNLETNVWTKLAFSFPALDGKPHVRLLFCPESSEIDLFYDSNYSGTYGYSVSAGTWRKMADELAPFCFRFSARGASTVPARSSLSSTPTQLSSTSWAAVNAGLPPRYAADGMVSAGGFLYLSISRSVQDGVYQFDGERWHHIAKPASQYGTGKLVAVDDHIFAQGHNSLLRLSLSTENEAGDSQAYWVPVGMFLRTEGQGFALFGGKQSIYLVKDTVAPKIFELTLTGDLKQATLVDLAFPFSGLDGKPHIQLVEDPEGNVWYESNYSGTFRYDRVTKTWAKANSRSGILSVAADGTIFLSYEITPTTQISSFFTYEGTSSNGTHLWTLRHTDQGYGIGCVPFDGAGSLFCVGGRFPEFVLQGTKKWTLPPSNNGVDFGVSEACRVPISFRGAVFCDLTGTLGNRTVQVMQALEVDLSGPYYDSDLAVSSGTYLSSEAGQARAVKILSDGRILAAFDTNATTFGGVAATLLAPGTTSFPSLSAPGRGRLLILNEDASAVVGALAAGFSIYDVAVAPLDASFAVVALQAGVAKVRLADGQVLWFHPFQSTKKKLACSGTQVAAMLQNNVIALLSAADGTQVWNLTLATRSYTEDVSVTDGVFVVAGFDNRKLPSGLPVQVSFLEGRSLTNGELLWSRFSFPGGALTSNIADTRLYESNIGKDGKLYLLGESAGTETIFRYNGTVYSGQSVLTVIDFYNA